MTIDSILRKARNTLMVPIILGATLVPAYSHAADAKDVKTVADYVFQHGLSGSELRKLKGERSSYIKSIIEELSDDGRILILTDENKTTLELLIAVPGKEAVLKNGSTAIRKPTLIVSRVDSESFNVASDDGMNGTVYGKEEQAFYDKFIKQTIETIKHPDSNIKKILKYEKDIKT